MRIVPIESVEHIAQEVERVIRSKANPIIGISADRYLIPVFQRLVQMHKQDNLDFSDVVFVLMGEYYGISSGSPKSCYSFLRSHLFDRVNISSERIHYLNGLTPENELDDYCYAYEDFIEQHEPDLWLFSLGCNGRVAFNEPGSRQGSQTRMIYLSHASIDELDLGDIDSALTVGINTILKGGKSLVLVQPGLGELLEKAYKVVSSTVPCSYIISKSCKVFVLAE